MHKRKRHLFIISAGLSLVGLTGVFIYRQHIEERQASGHHGQPSGTSVPETTSDDGNSKYEPTPLVKAVVLRDVATAKQLVESGADVNERLKGMLNMTPLLSAVHSGATNMVGFLLEHGADVNMADANGTTPLMLAVMKGDSNAELVKKLISAGADVNAKDKHQTTALGFAKSLGSAPTIQLVSILVAAGAKE